MKPIALLDASEYVWLPRFDAGRPEPEPPGAHDILAVRFRRAAGPDHAKRTVTLETRHGPIPLPRRIRLHGDADEGWDWGWRGSAPLETALNILAAFVHGRAAWRLQWAFHEAVLYGLPLEGACLEADTIREWIRENRWIGRQADWLAAAETERQTMLDDERDASRWLSAAERAERCARLVRGALVWDGAARTRASAETRMYTRDLWGSAALADGANDPGTPGFELLRAAAVLDGAPPAERWSTLAELATHIPEPNTPAERAWHGAASPYTPGLPDPATVRTVATVVRLIAGQPAQQRAELLADTIRTEAERIPNAHWRNVPALAVSLGAEIESAYRGEACLAGDPVHVAATAAALGRAFTASPELAEAATRLALNAHGLSDRIAAANHLHLSTLRDRRRAIERAAQIRDSYLAAAEAARLPRSRSNPPPPTSLELRRWVLAVPSDVLVDLARYGRTAAGPPAVAEAMRDAGLCFPDPPGTIATTLRWYLEERMPRMLDMPSFPFRGDGLRAPSRAQTPHNRPRADRRTAAAAA